MLRRLLLGLPLALAALTVDPAPARAFCGFYVAGADAKLFNNATMVVLMREGTRTVLSMQNNYQGPPEDFAMVVPVPVVLQKENVKTLPEAIFDRVDKLAAPRLVEYWEQDPCLIAELEEKAKEDGLPPPMAAAAPGGAARGVKIEAQFKVGEYDVVILSAGDSTGLDAWLRENKYKIPEGAEPILKPYVQAGMKFFVAKVDAAKVRFEKGMAKLSPLRFHYDSESFSLPVRLGLLNSAGTQDLIVHIIARGQRYEVANYKNVTIPTNLDVAEEARAQFGSFYAALFDRTMEENPGAVVTEYAWGAGSCDPCPSSPLQGEDFATLGGDALPGGGEDDPWNPANSYVLTRLHARYRKDTLGEDLVFRTAKALWGGREVPGANGKLETGAREGGFNNFQGRYAIRHPWKGPIACANPRRGVWGGPPAGHSGASGPQVAQDLAFAPRGGVKLASFVTHDVPEIGLKAAAAAVAAPGEVPAKAAAPAPSAAPASSSAAAPASGGQQASGGCGGCATTGGAGEGALAAGALALAAAAARRRRNPRSSRF